MISSYEFWKAKALTAEEISQLPEEISRFVDLSTGYWSKELLAAQFPDGERRSCRWGCNAHHYRSMKEASVHFIQQREGLGTYVPSCQKYRQKVDYDYQFILCDPSCTIGGTNLHLYLRHHWYHEMRDDGAPCVCVGGVSVIQMQQHTTFSGRQKTTTCFVIAVAANLSRPHPY